jgi:alanyl aminopeptidase
VPIIDVAVLCGPNGASAHLTQSPLHVLPDASAARTWAIPVCMRVEGVRDPVCARLDGPTADVPLPRCPAWILPNESERGYYRFGLDRKWLVALATAAPKSLGEAERAALPSHAWAMFQAGRIAAGDVLEVLAAMDLGHEPSRLVLESSIAVLTSARDTFIEEGARAKFAAFVSRLLRPALARLGEERKAGESDDARLARQAVTAALFDLASDPGVAATAEKRAAAWLADPNSVDPDLGALALRVSSRAGGVARPETLLGRLEHDATPSDRVVVLVALASSADPKVLERTLGLVVQGKIRVGDFRYVWGGAARMPDARKIVLDWMLGHFDELASHVSGAGGLAGAVGWTCTRADQERVATFFRGKLAELEGASRSFDEGLQQSELCIVSRSKGAGDATKWLAR